MAKFRITSPEGQVFEVTAPEGATEQQILQFATQQMQQQPVEAPQPQQQAGFFSGVGQDISKRVQNIEDIKGITRAGGQTAIEGGLQQGGQAAGLIGDIAGEALAAAGRGIAAITPESVKEFAGELVDDASDNRVIQLGAQAIQAGGEAYDAFKESFPRAARNVEGLVNVGVLAAPVKAKAPKPSPLKRAADVVGEAAETQAQAQKKSFVSDLIQPKQTASVRTDQVARTVEEGLLGKKTVLPSAKEASIIDEVSKLPISNRNSLQGNFNIIQSEITKEATSLETALKKNNVIFPRREYNFQLKQAKERLSENPLLVGDAQKTAQRIINKMDSITKQNPSNALGLLKSRKQLDSWIKSQKGGSIFDPKNENALSIALREIRNTTNDFIDTKATNVAVKDSLKKQSNLFGALDNIAPKAADEASNAVTRLIQNTTKAIPLRGELAQSIAATGLAGGAIGGAALNPSIILPTALGVGAFKAGKFIKGPKAKKALSELLKKSDDALKTITDPELARQITADRALILSIINGEEVDDESIR